MLAGLQFHHADHLACLFGHKDVVVALQAFGERGGGSHRAECGDALGGEHGRNGRSEGGHAHRADRGQVIDMGGADPGHALYFLWRDGINAPR
ncbi:hypothetical protein D3C81_1442520 [compost metagenome]